MKKTTLLLTLIMSLVLSVFALYACGNKDDNKVALVGFEDMTVTVSLGDTYDFDLAQTSVKDKTGETYRVNIALKTKSGQTVEMVANSFDIVDEEGYVATCTVEITEKDVRTRTITFKVINVKGVLKSSLPENVKVNDTVRIPDMKLVESITGTTLVESMPYTVTYNGEIVQVDSAYGFVADKSGVYTVTYTADYSGKTYSQVVTITVERSEALANEVESFDSPLSVSNFSAFNGVNKVEWVESFNGENGVIKWTHSESEWPAFSFKPRQLMQAYEDGYDYLSVRMYVVDNSTKVQYLRLLNADPNYKPDGLGDSVKAGEWFDYVYDIDAFLENWTDEDINFSVARIWSKSGVSGGVIYISDISVVKSADGKDVDVAVTGDKTQGEELTLTLTGADTQDASFELYDKSGNFVTLDNGKFTADEGIYTITYRVSYEYRVAVKTFTVKSAYIGELTDEYDGVYQIDDEIAIIDMAVIDQRDGSVVADTMNYSVSYYGAPVSIADGKFTAQNSGKYVISYSAVIDGITVTASTSLNVERNAPKANEVESFDSNASIETTTVVNSTMVWLEEFEGKSGVIKITPTGAWPALIVPKRQAKEVYQQYDYIAFTMYTTTYDKNHVFLNVSTEPNETIASVNNKWVTYVFKIDRWFEGDNFTADGPNKLWWNFTSGAWNPIYIADISVFKMDIAVSGNVIEGEELTIELTSGTTLGITFDLIDPNGVKVTLDNGKFTAQAGIYTVKYIVDGVMSTLTKNFTVAPSVEGVLLSNFDTITEGDTVTIPNMKLINSISGTVLVTKMDIAVEYYGQEVTVTDGKFTALKSGVYTIIYSAEYDGETYTITREVTANRSAPKDNEVESFDSILSLNTTTLENASKQWLASFEGKDGVLKITPTGAWPALVIPKRQAKEVYQQYDYIAFTMYTTTYDKNHVFLNVANQTNETIASVNNKWVTYVFKIDRWFEGENFSTNSLNKLWWNFTSGAWNPIYIADISVFSADAEIIGDLFEGQDITVKPKDVTAGFDIELELYKNNQIVALSNDKFVAEEGTYTVKFKMASNYVTSNNGYLIDTKTFTVFPILDIKQESALPETIIKGDTVIISVTSLYNNLTKENVVPSMDYEIMYYGTDESGEQVIITNDELIAKAGLYEIRYFCLYESQEIERKVSFTVFDNAWGIYDNAVVAKTVSGNNSGQTTFIDQSAIDANSQLPAFDGTDTGYVKVTMGGSSKWFEISLIPQCTFEAFASADYYEVKLYIDGTDTHGFHFKNNKIANVTGGSWQTIKVPTSIWSVAEHSGFIWASQQDMFSAMKNTSFMTVDNWVTGKSIYIASITLGNNAVDATLGNNYAHFTNEALTGSKSGTQITTFDDRQCILIPGGSIWVNTFIKPGKTLTELKQYDKLRFTIYIEGTNNDIRFYSQIKRGTDNLATYYTEAKQLELNTWVTFEVDMDLIVLSHSAFEMGKNGIFCTNGTAFTNIYISKIECIND